MTVHFSFFLVSFDIPTYVNRLAQCACVVETMCAKLEWCLGSFESFSNTCCSRRDIALRHSIEAKYESNCDNRQTQNKDDF